MMYHEKFVAVVKHKGRIVRDDGGIVRLPFGSEYTILLKNKNSVKAVANVEVDGDDALQGHQIIVPANDTVEIRGWMRDMNKTNKFKFIKKTKEIQDHRGDRLDDGMIRVEYKFEKKLPEIYFGTYDTFKLSKRSFAPESPKWTYGNRSLSDGSTVNCCYSDSSTIPTADEGITIKGQKITQNYNYGFVGALENDSHVIILRLKGEQRVRGRVKKVTRPITTRSRVQCDVCGRRWKSYLKHCGNCGNYLH